VLVFIMRALATDENKNVASCYLFFVARPFHLGLKWEGGSASWRDHSSPLDFLVFEVAAPPGLCDKAHGPRDDASNDFHFFSVPPALAGCM
jgi:hypothetical protein